MVLVAFGAVGLPVLMASRTSGVELSQVANVTARICAVLCLVVPFLLLAIMDGRRGVKECWPFGLFVGFVFGLVKWLVAGTAVYNLTEVFARASVAAALVFLKFWHPTGGHEAAQRIGIPMDPTVETETIAPQSKDTAGLTANRIWMALVPYLLVVVVFGIAALPSVKAAPASADQKFASPLLSGLNTAAGTPAAHRA